MSVRRWPLLALLAVALVLLVGRAVAAVYVDYRWYQAMDAVALWRARAGGEFLVRVGSGTLAALFAFANLFAVRHSLVSVVLPRRLGNLEIGEEVPGQYLVGAAVVLAIAIGAVLALPGAVWTRFALLRLGIPFRETDPYFEADLGFFVYWLPVELTLYGWAMFAVILMTIVVTVLYALTPSLEWKQRSLYVSNYARRHLAVLGTLLLLLLAWSWRLDQFRALVSGSGSEGTFSYADYHANIPLDIWLSILTAGAAIVVLRFAWVGQVRVATGALTSVLVMSFLLKQLAPPMVHRFSAIASPVLRERPFARTQAAYARRAFAVDRLGRGDTLLAAASLRELAATVSIWDPEALARNAERSRAAADNVQGIEWVPSDRGLVATLAVRPALEDEESGRSWTLTRVLATAADTRGDVVRAPGTRDDETTDSVLVYEGARGYVILSDSGGRIAAAELSSGLSRLAHAWSLQNFRLLAGDLPRPGPRILVYPDLRERLRQMAPFFEQGTIISPIVDGDSLLWSIDLYATSEDYPLSHRVGLGQDSVTYVQHAAVALVNARSGRVTMVADSVLDPLARSWVRAFPSLFSPPSVLRDQLQIALPPPLDLARAQGAVIARYGLHEDGVRLGHIPWVDGSDTSLAGWPPPVWAVHGRAGVSWTQPVLDDADRLEGVVMATGGRDRGTWWLPAAAEPVRWSGVLDLLRHAIDSTVAGAHDGRVIRGQLRAVPVSGDIAFVQPAYAVRGDAPPALVRVAVVRGDNVLTGRTLAEAVGVVATTTPALPATDKEFHARITALYAEMRAAMQRGDWVAFGHAYDALGAILAAPPR